MQTALIVASNQSRFIERFSNDNILDCIEHSADIVGVGCARNVRIDLFVVVSIL